MWPITEILVIQMARFSTPIHSDEDFDLLYDVDSVSDVSDSRCHSSTAPGSSVAQLESIASLQRLAGPHEVPVVPHAACQDDVRETTEQFQRQSIRDEASSSSIGIRRQGSTKAQGNMMSDGLQYTKSMYSKLWNKDALIAVMG